MGAWDITMRESDYKLDLLGTVAKAQLKQMDFSAFHVTEAIELLQQDILEEIKRANRSCPPEKLDYYILSFRIFSIWHNNKKKSRRIQ